MFELKGFSEKTNKLLKKYMESRLKDLCIELLNIVDYVQSMTGQEIYYIEFDIDQEQCCYYINSILFYDQNKQLIQIPDEVDIENRILWPMNEDGDYAEALVVENMDNKRIKVEGLRKLVKDLEEKHMPLVARIPYSDEIYQDILNLADKEECTEFLCEEMGYVYIGNIELSLEDMDKVIKAIQEEEEKENDDYEAVVTLDNGLKVKVTW